MSRRLIDIIICTYQREDLLWEAVASLADQCDADDYGVIIVNNATQPLSANTSDYLLTSGCTVLHETSPGLSIARNAGIAHSRADWLVFFDDDARAPVGFVDRVRSLIETEDYDCFGGDIRSWWKYGQPRWLADDYGSKPPLMPKEGLLVDGYNWGSNIVIRRSALLAVDCFPTFIGMKGKALGYAAENIVQKKLRESGYRIGYDPELYIEHVVMQPKLQLQWHLKWAYATGRDGKTIFPEQYGLQGFATSIKNCFSRPIKGLWKWLTRSEYYWENLLLDTAQPICLLAGKVRSLTR